MSLIRAFWAAPFINAWRGLPTDGWRGPMTHKQRVLAAIQHFIKNTEPVGNYEACAKPPEAIAEGGW